MNNTIIVEKHELVDLWPGKQNAYKCIVLNPDNTKSEKIIPKAQCEVLMYFLTIQHKLSQAEVTKFKTLIESYGDERYYEAQCDASMDDAGEDI